MGKYKMMLVLPFVILVMVCWMNMDAGDKKLKEAVRQRTELIEEAESLENDKIYFRAAEHIEQALKIKIGDDGNNDELEQKLLYLYKCDENFNEWEKLILSRIKKSSATQEECFELIDYYISGKDFEKALDILKKTMLLFPDSEEMKKCDREIRARHSFVQYDYSDVGAAYGEFIAVRGADGMWGFAEANGGHATDYKYAAAASFSGKMGLVMHNNNAAMINSDRKIFSICHDEEVDGILLFDSVSAVLKAGDKYKLADTELETSEISYDFLGALSDNMRAFCLNGKWGFLDEEGDIVLPEAYDKIILNENYEAFGQGAAFAVNGSECIMIDKDGKKVGDNVYESAYPFSSNKADKGEPAAVMSGGQWGFADSSGTLVTDYIYDDAKSFSSGFAAVKSNGKWGFINRQQEEAVPFEYDEVRPFEDGYAAVKSNGKWGFIHLEYYNC